VVERSRGEAHAEWYGAAEVATRSTDSARLAYRVESYVNWCGHTQEVIPCPRPDGWVVFIPVLGEPT
jgi:hypothetical protein